MSVSQVTEAERVAAHWAFMTIVSRGSEQCGDILARYDYSSSLKPVFPFDPWRGCSKHSLRTDYAGVHFC